MNLRKLLHPVRIAQKLYWLLTDKALIIDADSLAALHKDADKNRSFIKDVKIQNPPSDPQHLFGPQFFEDKLLDNMKPPVFIFGPPRSGSTYLVQAMNMHEKVYITNELRVMSFINDLFRLFLKSERMNWNLDGPDKGLFLQHFRKEMSNLVKRFYLERMPSPDAVWGDKHPHYSDPAMDPGALDTISELFPDAKFIHIYRNPRTQVHSVISKGWKDFKYAVRAYKRIITVGQSFGKKIGPARYLEVRYEDLCDNGEDVANEICSFLGIQSSERWLGFMRQQELKRTPFSAPVTNESDIGVHKIISFSSEEEAYFEKILGKLPEQLGYF
jgi:hypothetical protein